MTTNELTQYVLKYLRAKNVLAWRHNNVGIWDKSKGVYRKNPQTLKGVADIIGIDKFGRMVAIEIKSNKDKLTNAQMLFLQQVEERGGGAFVCRNFTDFKKKFENWYDKGGKTKHNEQVLAGLQSLQKH